MWRVVVCNVCTFSRRFCSFKASRSAAVSFFFKAEDDVGVAVVAVVVVLLLDWDLAGVLLDIAIVAVVAVVAVVVAVAVVAVAGAGESIMTTSLTGLIFVLTGVWV